MRVTVCLFVCAVLVSNLLVDVRTDPVLQNGCVASGLSGCCTLDTCVTRRGCYCDQGCYDTDDCCEDIQQTCPPLEGGSEDGGSGDPPTMEPPSTRPPRITLAPEENITVPTAHPHRITMLVRYDRGFPLSTLVWRKDGEIITSSTNPRLNIMSSGGVTIRSVTPSDRGLYTITVSNTVGSDSASFKLFTKFTDIVETDFKERSFHCKARGYPSVNFIGWTAMNGSNITHSERTTFQSVTSEFETTMIARLPLDAVDCAMGGVSCVFDNGMVEYGVQSPMMDCPTVIEIGFEDTEYTISEQAATNQYIALRVCLKQTNTLVTNSSEPFTVTIATQGGTAIMGVDFVAILSNRTISFPLGQHEVCECLSVIQDDITEGEEVFYLTLTSSHPQVRTTGAAVHILDDDAVIAHLERAEYFVSEGDGCVEVCAVLIGRYQRSITVYFCIEGINATAGKDYIGRDMAVPVTFQAPTVASPELRGRSCASIKLINDNVTEMNETLRVSMQLDDGERSVVLGNLSSATVTIVDDDRRPLTATLINDTPRVDDISVTINFRLDGGSSSQLSSLRCNITGPGRTPPLIMNNCSSGVVEAWLPPRKQEFCFTLEEIVGGPDGEHVLLLERDFRLDSDVCWLHLVNEGVVVNGSSVTFEWQPSGPFVNYKSTSFRCLKDFAKTKEECSSPYTWSDLSPGEHRLVVEPYQTLGCRRLLSRTIRFTV